MTFHVEVLNETNGPAELTPERATELCARTFRERGLDTERMGELSVVLVNPELMRDLNLKFRRKDTPTDVLSFELDGPYGEVVGEIVICPEYAEMEVEELVVHGALHLSGMDHGEDFEASEMARVQARVMEAVRGG